ncbi:MAG TPA: homoserine kinase [Gaiellaceae bacterium]|nr:homoserine kinase [Gaiellaceae bacterium]
MRIHVRAPATTANLGPAFDCAAVALELWNELEVTNGNGDADPSHLGIRAFARFAPADGLRFEFVDRVPRERGLGSSASVVALGLVAGAVAAGVQPDAERLLAAGLDLEGHGDNLAAALAGGVCLTWEQRIARIADDTPATPIAVVPAARVNTAKSRASLPVEVTHADAAFNAGRGTLLGAALASGSTDLFAAALHDRLHEPYRSPFLDEVRNALPDGALGATLSGSGPTVIVWAERTAAGGCATELAQTFPEQDVRPLAVATTGAVAAVS